jgi:hypothetical protein
MKGNSDVDFLGSSDAGVICESFENKNAKRRSSHARSWSMHIVVTRFYLWEF